MDGAHVSHRATHAHRADYSPVKTHKNQSFSSHKPSNGKTIMFFVIPEMPSKTFVMGLKKLPDHLKNYLFYWGFSSGEGGGGSSGFMLYINGLPTLYAICMKPTTFL